MIDWQALTLFLYITARMSGFVLFDPIFGRRSLPGIFRAGLALVLAVFVFEMSGQRAPVPVGTAELAVRLLLEIAMIVSAVATVLTGLGYLLCSKRQRS